MPEQNYCPLLKGKCRKDCTWFHIFTTITPDGVDQYSYCAVSVIANRLCDIAGYGSDE